MTLYDGVLSNVFGNDRKDAISVIDDDVRFDRWLEAYESKQSQPQGSGGTVSAPKEKILKQFENVGV